MSMYKKFETDSDLERQGIELDYGDFRVTIARAGGANKKFAKISEAKTKPYARAIQTDTLDPKVDRRLTREIYAESVVLNWEVYDPDSEQYVVGIEKPDGSIGEVTVENICEAFENLPELFSDIISQATKASLFRSHVQEADAGN